MNTQQNLNYARIEKAIGYLKQNFRQQPDLDDVAKEINLSPYHFQRLFTEWAGVSPKKFLQYLSVEYAKGILKDTRTSLADAAFETGLSGTGRLHDLFVNIEGMTPGEFKNGGENLEINYSYAQTHFGDVLVASTAKGVCYMAFEDKSKTAFKELLDKFPNAKFTNQPDAMQNNVISVFNADWNRADAIKLHLKGTDFQLKVWESLLKIPAGHFTTYGDIAETIQKPKASRAVGSAIGQNPVAFLIPCHRVIQATGAFGQYHWGEARKAAMLGWEAVSVNTKTE